MAAKAEKAAKGTLKDVIERYLAAHETPKGAPSKYWRDRRARLFGRAAAGIVVLNILES